jgi:hypothetical protein
MDGGTTFYFVTDGITATDLATHVVLEREESE